MQKKSEKFCTNFWYYLKNLILGLVQAPFDSQTFLEFSQKVSIRSSLSLRAIVTFCKKFEKFWA